MKPIMRGRFSAAVLLPLTVLALSAIPGAAPGAAAAARTGITAACPAPRSFTSLPLFAHVTGADDVMIDAIGNVWVSSVTGSQVTELSPAGTVLQVFTEPSAEGMVQLDASTMALANQKADTVGVFNPATGQVSPWLQLTRNGRTGVDGLGVEPGALLLPDSAQGKLDTVPLPPGSGGPVTVATGLGRPVDAVPVGDGTLLVSVENPPGLDRVNPATGTVTPAANIKSTDDVVLRNGIAYVADNGNATFSAVSLSSVTVTTLVTGVIEAQGLALRADGTFLVVSENLGDIRVATGC